MGRVRSLLGLRQEKAQRIKRPEGLKLDAGDATRSGSLVLEAIGLTKSFTDGRGVATTVADDVSFTVRRGDRIGVIGRNGAGKRSEEHTSELQSLMRLSYAVFCLKNKINNTIT